MPANCPLLSYQTPVAERLALQHWLSTALIKLDLATDDLYTAFLINTTLWKLAEGICAVNNRPVPPSTLMWELLPTLPQQPQDWLKPLLTGKTKPRLNAFRLACEWVVRMLDIPDV